MSTLANIARGWSEFAKAKPYTQNLMAQRLQICDQCPLKVQMNGLGKLIVTLINDQANTFRCGKCGCPLSALTADPSSRCKLGKWKAAGEESYY